MLMFLGFIVLIACLVIGVRRGGIGLATILLGAETRETRR